MTKQEKVRIYPHLPPERSFGEHMMAIADIFIAKGNIKSHSYKLTDEEVKNIKDQSRVNDKDKKYLFTPYTVAKKLPMDTVAKVKPFITF